MTTVKPKDATKKIAVSAKIQKGLCVTCNHAESCAACNEAREPVWYCEEFDDHMAPAGKSDVGEAPHVRTKVEPKPNGAADGLCGNCETRAACSYRNPEIPIWYCEQFC